MRLDCTDLTTCEWSQVHNLKLSMRLDELNRFREQLREIFQELEKDGSFSLLDDEGTITDDEVFRSD